MIEMKQLRIVFFGTPEFAVESLEALIGAGFDIAAVVTMPDKIGGRGHRVIESAVKLAAIAHGLPVLQPEKLSAPEFVDRLKEIAADLFIVIAFHMLPRVVWTMPPMGTFNLHASLLPRYRGAAPINRAIMNGETRTGVTTFLLKHEIDTGDILAQESTAIGPDENVGSLYGRLMKIGAGLTVSTVRAIAEGTAKPVPQDNVTVDGELPAAPKIFHSDCRIDWTASAENIHNLVRGLSPMPGAWCEVSSQGPEAAADYTLKILRTARTDCEAPDPGMLRLVGGQLVAGTAGGAIVLLEVQQAGKKVMDAVEWYRGTRDGVGGRCICLI